MRKIPKCEASLQEVSGTNAGLIVHAFKRRSLPLLLGVCVLSAGVVSCSGSHEVQQSEAEQNWNRLRADVKLGLARQHFERGHIDQAITVLEEATAMDPENPTYPRFLAKCYLEQGELNTARRAADRAERLGGLDEELAYTLGMIAERRGRYEDALRHHQRAVEQAPTNVAYQLAAAECLVSLDRPAEARAFLDEQIENREGDEQLFLLHARICVLMNDLEQASDDFRMAQGLLADTEWASEEFGLVLVRLGRYAEALAVLQPLVESTATFDQRQRHAGPSPAVIRGMAQCLNSIGEPRRAKSLLQEHLQHARNDGRAWWLLGESHIRLGDLDGVRRCVQRGEHIAPQVTDWKLFRAYLAWHSGETAAAAALLESIVNEKPGDILSHCFLGEVYARQGDLERARAQYKKVIQLDPDDAWAGRNLRLISAGQ